VRRGSPSKPSTRWRSSLVAKLAAVGFISSFLAILPSPVRGAIGERCEYCPVTEKNCSWQCECPHEWNCINGWDLLCDAGAWPELNTTCAAVDWKRCWQDAKEKSCRRAGVKQGDACAYRFEERNLYGGRGTADDLVFAAPVRCSGWLRGGTCQPKESDIPDIPGMSVVLECKEACNDEDTRYACNTPEYTFVH